MEEVKDEKDVAFSLGGINPSGNMIFPDSTLSFF